jgi:hypothetical protein
MKSVRRTKQPTLTTACHCSKLATSSRTIWPAARLSEPLCGADLLVQLQPAADSERGWSRSCRAAVVPQAGLVTLMSRSCRAAVAATIRPHGDRSCATIGWSAVWPPATGAAGRPLNQPGLPVLPPFSPSRSLLPSTSPPYPFLPWPSDDRLIARLVATRLQTCSRVGGRRAHGD